MRFVGEGQHLFVATTITISREVIGLAIREALQNTVHLLLSITVFCQEMTCQTTVFDFYLCSQHLHGREERLYPVIISASIDNWVQPFFPSVKVLGTQIEVKDGCLTGHFLTRSEERRVGKEC